MRGCLFGLMCALWGAAVHDFYARRAPVPCPSAGVFRVKAADGSTLAEFLVPPAGGVEVYAEFLPKDHTVRLVKR